MKALRKLLPTPDQLRESPWLRWLGPAVFQPRLWHISRRGLAMGVALGMFFGLLIPIAQIPVSAAAAVVLRANVPAAVASTLVTNPVTFGPVYYAAWQLGQLLLGDGGQPGRPPELAKAEPPVSGEHWWDAFVRRLASVGKPLVLGLAVMATTVGLSTYYLVSWFWVFRVRRKRRARRRQADV